MNKKIVASFALTACLALGVTSAASAAPDAENAQVIAKTGKVLVKASGQGWAAHDKQNLQVGDIVRTGVDGEAVILLSDDSSVRLAAGSEMRVIGLESGGVQLQLDRGRMLGHAGSNLSVATQMTKTDASKGDFVLDTSDGGAKLDVLSGNAKLAALDGSDTDVASLDNLPEGADSEALGDVDSSLNDTQVYGDLALMQWKGKWKGKGSGARSDDSDEAVGGGQQTSPDGDVRQPTPPRRPVQPVQPVQPVTPPTTVVTPPPTVAPPVTPPVTPPPAPVAAGGGSFLVPALIGAAVIGGIIIVANDDDNDDQPVIQANPSASAP